MHEKNYRVIWSNGEDECSFGCLVETFGEAELVLLAYHNMAEFLGMDKNNFRIDGLKCWSPNVYPTWRKIPSSDYEKHRVYE